jgi:hypothetical protein
VYEVSCPSCQALISSPFVRVGAAVTCASCKHRYLIDQSHIKHVPSSVAVGESGPGPLADQTQTPGAGGEVEPGLTDLSEVMRREAERERSSQFDDYDTIRPSVDTAARPSDVVDPLRISDPAAAPAPTLRQRVVRNGYLFAAISAAALAVLGGGITYVTRSVSPDGQPGGGQPRPVYQGPTFNDMPLAASIALGHTPWTQPNTPYQSQPQQDPGVYIDGDRLDPTDAGEIDYVGQVVTENAGVIVDAELTLSLVDPQGIEKARTTIPVAMVSSDRPMRLRLPIPANLDPTKLNTAWSISVFEVLDPVVVIEGVSVAPLAQGSDTMALLRIDNNTPHALNRCVLVVTAWNAQEEPLKRWKVSWDSPIASGDRVEFYARTAVMPSWRISRWSVDSAGESQADTTPTAVPDSSTP